MNETQDRLESINGRHGVNKILVRDVHVRGKRVLVRVDFEMSLDKTGTIGDDGRIRAALPTIRRVVLLENRRVPAREAKNASDFIGALNKRADVCVNDAFANMTNASTGCGRSFGFPGEKRLPPGRRVFIVHGRQAEDLKNELARILERLQFEPVILHEQPDKGQTIISKLNTEMADVGFAFVIYTSDDVGSLASEVTQVTDLRGRARQNVVLEHGLFIGHLSAARVCAIRTGDVEIPADLQGVLFKNVPLGGDIRSISLELANELRAAGYALDVNRLLSVKGSGR